MNTKGSFLTFVSTSYILAQTCMQLQKFKEKWLNQQQKNCFIP